jgi:hypothetical protein
LLFLSTFALAKSIDFDRWMIFDRNAPAIAIAIAIAAANPKAIPLLREGRTGIMIETIRRDVFWNDWRDPSSPVSTGAVAPRYNIISGAVARLLHICIYYHVRGCNGIIIPD